MKYLSLVIALKGGWFREGWTGLPGSNVIRSGGFINKSGFHSVYKGNPIRIVHDCE